MKSLRAAMAVTVNKDIRRVPSNSLSRQAILYASKGEQGVVEEMIPQSRKSQSVCAKVRMTDGTLKTLRATSLTF